MDHVLVHRFYLSNPKFFLGTTYIFQKEGRQGKGYIELLLGLNGHIIGAEFLFTLMFLFFGGYCDFTPYILR